MDTCEIWTSDVWLWWLEHGLDGIGAGIVGVLGVAGTLWWDRRQRSRAAEEAKREEGRTAVRQILAAAVAGKQQLTADSTPQDVRKVVNEVREVLAIDNHVLQREAPLLANQSGALMIGLQMSTTWREVDSLQLVYIAGLVLESVRRRCDEWQKNPIGYTGEATDAAETKVYRRPVREQVADFAIQRHKEPDAESQKEHGRRRAD